MTFSPDKRYLAYCAALTVWFYWTARRCVALVGRWPCGGGGGGSGGDNDEDDVTADSCSSAVEWIVAAACAAQAATSVAVAAIHRWSRSAELLNAARDVLAGSAGSARCTSHVTAGAWYAAAAAAVVAARSAAVVAARPDRFAAADVLALYVPAVAAAVGVECAIVCVCSAAERAGHDAVDRLRRLAADVAGAASLGRGAGGPKARLPVHWRLECVWRDHWRGCRLVDRLSRCHGLDLAVNLTASMLLFVVYAYVNLMTVYGTVVAARRPVTAAAVHWNLALACQLACVSFRIVFMSYRAERIKQVVSRRYLMRVRSPLSRSRIIL